MQLSAYCGRRVMRNVKLVLWACASAGEQPVMIGAHGVSLFVIKILRLFYQEINLDCKSDYLPDLVPNLYKQSSLSFNLKVIILSK